MLYDLVVLGPWCDSLHGLQERAVIHPLIVDVISVLPGYWECHDITGISAPPQPNVGQWAVVCEEVAVDALNEDERFFVVSVVEYVENSI